MFGLGFTEILVILVLVLILFGAGKLPQVMGDLGKGLKSFKDEMDGKAKNASTNNEVMMEPKIKPKAIAAKKKTPAGKPKPKAKRKA